MRNQTRKTRDDGRETRKNLTEHFFNRPSSFILLKLVFILLMSSFVLLPSSLVQAAVPHLINYQGRLTDSAGKPVTDGSNYTIIFRIYDSQSGGNLLWQETHNQVLVQKGLFNILLGSVYSLDLSFNQFYFLEMVLNGEVMGPRQQISSAGYSMNSERVGGKQLSELIVVPSGSQQGDILIRDQNGWTRLPAGTPGQYLKTQGASANPAWSGVVSAIYDYGSSTSSYTTKSIGDLKICYGTLTCNSSGTAITNLPFTSANSYRVVANYANNSENYQIGIVQNSGSQFTAYKSQGSETVHWIAIGT